MRQYIMGHVIMTIVSAVYLSWTRNAAICAGVGASVYMLEPPNMLGEYLGDG